MSDSTELKLKVLEAMSLIYEICLKKEDYHISEDTDFYHQLLKVYNSLQLLRDDSTFMAIETDIDDKLIRRLKQKRIEELIAPPFCAVKDQWMK